MPKAEGEIQVTEGGPIMDPTGTEFQAMLEKARSGAAEKLPASDPEKDVNKASSATEPDPKVENPGSDTDTANEDEPTDDVGTLKKQLAGLQAELTRVRKQRSSGSEEAGSLKERIASLEGQIQVLRESKPVAGNVEEKIAKLTDEQASEALDAWEDERVDARVAAQTAARDGDQEALVKANQRIQDANRVIRLYKSDIKRRETSTKQTAEQANVAKQTLAKELDELYADAYGTMPDLKDQKSDLWKAGQAEYAKYPTLMKQLGPLGELVAVARAVSKNPALVGKKAAVDVLTDAIEQATEKSFRAGGTAPTGGTTRKNYAINSAKDAEAFEAEVARIKKG